MAKTKFFLTYEDFKCRPDKRVNGLLGDPKDICELSDTGNLGCWECHNCTECVNCHMCKDCILCVNCRESITCTKCTEMVFCKNCINSDRWGHSHNLVNDEHMER